MQQFAMASIYPRNIAWLIRSNEWDRLERIIKYNCAMVGGYFNVIIPLTDQDTLADEYYHFLHEYDPDLVVLPPGLTSNTIGLSLAHSPFGIIPWEKVSEIVTLDPWSGGTGLNVTIGPGDIDMENAKGIAIVAVADNTYPDVSRFALVACGDVAPRQLLLDDEMQLDATGHREVFLARALKPEYQRYDIEAQLRENLEFVPALDRYQLAKLIFDEHKFPLSNAVKVLQICCRTQHMPDTYQTFIGLTANYKQGGTPRRTNQIKGKSYPSIAILVSDSFGLEEAVLFWNLRASGVFVAWLSFRQLADNAREIVKWLDYN